ADIDLFVRTADLLAALAEVDLADWARTWGGEIDSLVARLQSPPIVQGPVPRVEVEPAALAAGSGAGKAVESVPEAGISPAAGPSLAPPAPGPGEPPPGVPPAVPGPASTAPEATPPGEGKDGVVRVTAGSLNRLMNLAGESLVQARW